MESDSDRLLDLMDNHGRSTTMHLFLVVVVVLLASCGPQPSEGLHRLFHEYFEDYLRENPEVATSLGLSLIHI